MNNQANTRRGKTQAAVNKNSRHAEKSLLSISTITNNTHGSDPEQKHFRMTLWNAGAFTLIELLVVVLIIGILAAVALPQYQKAVMKTKIMQGIVALNAVEKAQELYLLEHGAYNPDWQNLDITVSASIACHFSSAASWCQFYGNDFILEWNFVSGNHVHKCFAISSNKVANAACRSYATKDTYTEYGSYNIYRLP